MATNSQKNRKILIAIGAVCLATIFLVALFNGSTPPSSQLRHAGHSEDDATNYNKYYAKYYDLLYEDKNYSQEVKYLHKKILQFYKTDAKPSDLNLLELGVGTGKHAYLLNLNYGYNIYGVDLSKGMIEHAKGKYPTSDSLHYEVGDARYWRHPSGKKFNVVMSLFHVMSYQTSNEDLENSFKTVAAHLKPNGVFIFDVWYGPAVLKQEPAPRKKEMENDEVSIVRHATPDVHPNSNTVDVLYDIEVKDKHTGELTKFHEKHPMRYLFRPELEYFLKQVNMELLDTEEWMTEKTSGFNTWGVTCIAKMKEA